MGSTESLDLSYKRLSFEDFLFTSSVYKRNFRNKRIAKPIKPKATTASEPGVLQSQTRTNTVVSNQTPTPPRTSEALPIAGGELHGGGSHPGRDQDETHTSVRSIRGAREPLLDLSDLPASFKSLNAIVYENLDTPKLLITKGAPVEEDHRPWQPSPEGLSETLFDNFTPLQLAVQRRQAETVKLLLDGGAPVECGKPRPLILACGNGCIEITQLLIEHGASAGWLAGNDDDYGPIHSAVKSGNAELVKYLCRMGVDKESVTMLATLTPLQVACYNDKPLAVEALLSMGAKLPSSPQYLLGKWSRQPHVIAIRTRSLGVLEKLIASDGKALLVRESSTGRTVLQVLLLDKYYSGAQDSMVPILHLLLSCSELVSAADNMGSTPLHIAVVRCTSYGGPVRKVLGMLVAAGADIHTRNDAGYDPLFIACCWGEEITIRTLLELGATVTPEAEPHSHYEAIKWRLDRAELKQLLDEAVGGR
jgi:ankyrin repeat protein